MAYFAPYIDAAGLHVPTYVDIRDDLLAKARSIYGQDIYLENDSADYQLISDFALKLSDTLQAAVLVYNNRSPSSASGAALDGLIKLNGVKRKTPSYSTCPVVLTGDNGTVISGGIVQDVSGHNWDLPDSVTLDSSGSANVSAVCQTIGAVTAQPGDIAKIMTPTKGWVSVTNTVAATPGQAVEKDSAVRSRQAISTANPSQTLLEGTTGGIASVEGVTRYRIYENDTNVPDTNGLPPHSITAVVEGGADAAVAEEIRIRKGIGGYTNGDMAVETQDSYGQPITIRFYRPTYVPIYVSVNIKSKSGYTTATTLAIQKAVVNYLNSLRIGDDLTISSVWGAALSVIPDLASPIFSITSLTVGKSIKSQGTADIDILFNEVTSGDATNVAINVS
jgi:uncharacterized phage protein gp47/JayE